MSTIILTRGVAEYRATIGDVVRPTDTVLEVGCAWGTTSALLHERAHALVAVDTSSSIETARETYPAIQFEQVDAFDVRALLRLGTFSVIYVDLSGSRSPEPIMRLVRRYDAAFRPRALVIKNTRLKRFVSSCVVWEPT